MRLRDLPRVLRSIAIVSADSERTEEIHVVEELTGARRFARARRLFFDAGEARDLLRDRPELRSDQVDFPALRALPADTLGFAYVDHLDRNGLSADSQAAPTRFVDSEERAFLVRRFRQTHDVWHALTGLGISGHEEVILHAFSWGQLRLPVSALVVVFGSLKHGLLEGRFTAMRQVLVDAYRVGRAAKPLLPVYWERHWSEPLDRVRSDLHLAPFCAAEVRS
jgi:ubiquinone biosynthesis protein COQ4